MKHKRFLKNQVRLEITAALLHMPLIAVLTTPIFWAEVCIYAYRRSLHTQRIPACMDYVKADLL
ncbi:hypothetical protein SARC_03600 [Sphaeroforma arctica JP610]|uniref:Uncharacterized protein n=1 Tax=Sphaeroforma arctica JP610 TaxID=667725 RepID=A0A0L0G7I0_9EUKA|nr:hypothetical protein SARC_03600 [Sphaeroforma arctica JP610]KNC84178.1 hypothetical protein SARC_03600 [Sphaeroforma arctica JP610]|eukprot:XP_014158080.1 hypothetical protein SARC_03600 [Sphaeroforma arctica JP610]